MENVLNETVKYGLAMLKRTEIEMIASQSARLAMGFLEFDVTRFVSELKEVIRVLETSKPVDYPETHPDSMLTLVE